MLEIKNLVKIFNKGTINERVALNGVDLTLNDGDFVTVIGGNGAGKSTILNAVAGKERAVKASVDTVFPVNLRIDPVSYPAVDIP